MRLVTSLEKASHRDITIGTLCSGTDMPVYQLNKLCDYWESSHGVRPRLVHVFSCDTSPVAQRFIQKNHAPRFLFRDISELGGDMAFDVKSNSRKPVQSVTIAIGGTECDNYSALNFSTRAGEGGPMEAVVLEP